MTETDRTNSQLARLFEQMAAALDLLGKNAFRVNASARVARVIRDQADQIANVIARAREEDTKPLAVLKAIDGIGKGSAEKIIEYVDTGTIAEHTELMEQVPAGLFDVLEIPGLGPKTVRLMWEQLSITCVADLKGKLDSEELAALPRMGKKTIDNIRQAITFAEESAGRTPLGIARPIALALVEHLKSVSGVTRAEYAGSLRRGCETIGDIDILVACTDPEAVREAFCTQSRAVQVLARGETKCSIRIRFEHATMQADLRIVPQEAFGAALMYFTGSKDHNVRLREVAIGNGMRLNEYGLFTTTDERPQDAGIKPTAAQTEQDVFAALGLEWIPPEMREDRGEVKACAEGMGVPHLITRGDIKAELHAHTDASDGKQSLEELVASAQKRGYHTLAVTDHSVSSVIANGLDPKRLRRHIKRVRALNEKTEGITILAGSEVDIHPDGRLDYDDDLLAELDVVVASPHVSLRQDRAAATRRLLAAVTHPRVHILGHPTGRIINGRAGLDPDLNELFAAAAEHGTALEINSSWKRLDLRDTHVRAAVQDFGCLIAIDTDAHSDGHFENIEYGILTARRAWLEPESCINTWAAGKLHDWLAGKRESSRR
ncbi:MAG: DNA polymerase/3'-5' exonuclease PolX [Planctomycetes bacterium]|nr:DNA polymerase/3'-5' exonuclease PolX [Planctomycetota bacterium]NOG55015.1 DNA polymerase/3'-5' exonuclease PolX [Planctomycetota bacterium]